MKKLIGITVYIVILISVFINLSCYGSQVDYPTPNDNFFVNDFANVIDTETEWDIQNIAVQLHEKTTAQVVVVTIDSLEGQSIEEYAVNLFRKWGIGTAEKNNGVLILVAIEDRWSRIEVGYGLEGALTDAETRRIQDNYMIPSFQEGDYSTGIKNGFLATVRKVYDEYGIDIEDLGEDFEYAEAGYSSSEDIKTIVILIIVFIVLLIDWIFLRGRITKALFIAFLSGGRYGGGGRGGGFSGGGGRGGGFSGGGGRSGGGGSSRGW
ncbi:MAG TPA: TPM domain-containing protein [Clostridia bacterium]